MGGRLLERAETENNNTYAEVVNSGLGSLQSLGAEVYGRWSAQAIRLVPKLAAARTRTLHPRIKRGAALGLLHRWWGILGVALQRAVARALLNPHGDLPQTPLEDAPWLGDLEVV